MVLLALLTRSRAGFDFPPRGNSEGRLVVETIFDCLLAISVASWALAGLSSTASPVPLVRWAIAALHLTVAFHLLRRTRVRKQPAMSSIAVCLPAFVVAGCAMSVSAPLSTWPGAPQVLFVLGTLLTIYSFSALGSNFAFFPAVRGVAAGGPYRWVRHPAYAGELLMIAACVLSRPTPLTVVVLSIAVPLVGLRIRAEEALLHGVEEYRNYAARVPRRLVPGIW